MESAQPSEFSKGALNLVKFSSIDRNRMPGDLAEPEQSLAKRGQALRPVPGPLSGSKASRRSVPGAPWRLPSGQLLVEYALHSGFTGPTLLTRFPYTAPLTHAPESKSNPVLKSLENLSAALTLAAESPAIKPRQARRKSAVASPSRRGAPAKLEGEER